MPRLTVLLVACVAITACGEGQPGLILPGAKSVTFEVVNTSNAAIYIGDNSGCGESWLLRRDVHSTWKEVYASEAIGSCLPFDGQHCDPQGNMVRLEPGERFSFTWTGTDGASSGGGCRVAGAGRYKFTLPYDTAEPCAEPVVWPNYEPTRLYCMGLGFSDASGYLSQTLEAEFDHPNAAVVSVPVH